MGMSRLRQWLWRALACVAFALACSGVDAQVLLDRVLARVSGVPVTLTEVRAALGMGLIVAGPDEMALATEQWIQRRLLLLEVERFPPPEPSPQDIDAEEARIRQRIGTSLATLTAQTGLDERQLRQSARDTLRIRAYLDQRFGEAVQVSDEDVRAYYSAHPDEFRVNGQVPPFEAVETAARARASESRRQTTIDQWISDLRARADVSLTPPNP